MTETAETAPRVPQMRTMMLSLLWDVGLALIAYYGLRALGQSPFVSLLAGTIVSGLRVAWVAIKARRVDVFAGFLLAVFGVGLVLSFVTGSARFLLLKDSVGTGVAGLLFAGSCFVGRPLIFYAAKRMQGDGGARFEDLWATAEPFRKMFRLMSMVWGLGLLFEALVRIPLVFLLPIDVMTGLSSIMFIAAMVLLTVWTFGYVRRKLRDRPVPAAAE
ncbi:VC0807 family protein [Fodinicola feengrottensis]|uniref:Intracellular septation protein A n=1 Tax=Fodinicola feengrottensis TaxID=435914 RepID=A0ABN2GC91_9ACTN|nr:VC0807 family protein [Fodinicola feengrottensis]